MKLKLTTLVLASARTSGMMASVSSAWAASSRMMWVKDPGLRSEETDLELERVTTMMSASTRSCNVTNKVLGFSLDPAVGQNVRILSTTASTL